MIEGNIYYYCDGEYYPFEKVQISSPLSFFTSECPAPEITGFSPSNIAAGMNEILTITGNFFGDYDEEVCRVIFKNGDDGGGGEAVAEKGDIITWDKNLITLYVPSVTNEQTWRNPACSGRIKVKNACGEDPSDDPLSIPYAVFNRRIDLNDPAIKIGVKKQDAEGLTFEFSTNVPPEVRTAFIQALSEWCTETNVEYRISEEDSELILSQAGDNVNLIVMEDVGVSGGAAALAIGVSYFIGCQNSDTQAFGFAMADLDIKIDPESSIETPEELLKMKNKLIHELGHAHMLNHSKRVGVQLPQDEYALYYSLTNLNFNNLALTIKSDDSEGGNILFSNSDEIISGTACGLPIGQGGCGETNSVVDIIDTYFKVFPNPGKGELTLLSEQINLLNSQINIYSITGDLVYQGLIDRSEKLINNLPSGILILKIVKDDTVVSKKIIVHNE